MRTELIRKSLFCTAFLTGAFLFGCTEENVYTDVDGQNPSFELTTEHIRTLTGYEFTMSGKISDKDGISSINLYCPELFLDKTIDLVKLYSETQYEYNLSYSFTIPEDNKGESFKVKVTVTDLGGRTTEGEILITMDGDYTLPEFTSRYTSDIKKAYGDDMTVNVSFSATDDKGLQYLELDIPGLGINEREVCTSDPELKEGLTECDFNRTITLPYEFGTYKMYTRAVDLLNNEVVDSCNVIITLVEDYDKLYLSDVKTEEELSKDIFGVPMLIDHTDVNQYRARYYNRNAGTQIFFIPQKDNFNNSIGLDSNDPTKLSLENPVPIVLDLDNTYYDITLDLANATYTLRHYSAAEASYPWASNMEYGENTLDQNANGAGPWIKFVIGWSNSDPKNIQEFTQDATNPHLFYVDKTFPFVDGNNHNIMDFNFFISNYHPEGWWNFIAWYRFPSLDNDEGVFARFTEKGNRFINTEYDGPVIIDQDQNARGWTWFQVSEAGTYRFYFDVHLGRGKLLPYDGTTEDDYHSGVTNPSDPGYGGENGFGDNESIE